MSKKLLAVLLIFMLIFSTFTFAYGKEGPKNDQSLKMKEVVTENIEGKAEQPGVAEPPAMKGKADVKGSDRDRSEEKSQSDKQQLQKEKKNPFDAKPAKEKGKKAKDDVQIQVSSSLISMTEAREIEVEIDYGYEPNLEDLQWTFGGKAFDEWEKWSALQKGYVGDPFITFAVEPYVEGTAVKAVVKFDLVYTLAKRMKDNEGNWVYVDAPTADLSSRSVRTLYPALIGMYDLTVEDTVKGTAAQTAMKLNVYDSYRTYDELKPALDGIFAKAKSDRYLDYQVIGQSVEGRDLHFVVLAEDKASVNEYLNEMVPDMLENPALLQDKIQNGKLKNYKVPIFVNNIHPDEAPGIDAQLDALELLATKDTIEYQTTNEDGSEVTVSLNVKELLKNVIFVMNLTENPDGRYHNVRQNANGFDVNRDNGYQTQIESQTVVEQIAKWNPISFLDLHGFVKAFLIEPCTPPHDPNYEYDLLINNMFEQAHAMGKAGVANSKYQSYIIPYNDYGYGWDDAAPAYTATYAMHHGALGHTIEMPELNQDSNDAVVYAILASGKYVMDNKEKLFINQLEYYKRGVEGTDSREVDPWLVNAKWEVIGRPRGENDNFFPEYYVLPVDEEIQKNPLEVYHTVEYLLRNGVKVEKSTEEVTIGNTVYPAGTYVVDMHQAKRGYANTVLYQGVDVSDFQEMYAEIVMNFPALRGFDSYEVRGERAFEGKIEGVTSTAAPGTKLTGNSKSYVIRNTNNDAIKAVNELLSQSKEVKTILAAGTGYEKGDYLVSASDLRNICSKYFLDITPIEEASDISAKTLVMPKVSVPGSKQSEYILRELGFSIVDAAQSNVIVDDDGYAKKEDILSGKDYIGLGMWALDFVTTEELLPGLNWAHAYDYWCYEGLLKSSLASESPITAGYGENELLYVVDGLYITDVPEDATVLARVSNDDDFYVAGWWPGHEEAKGQVLAMTQKVGDSTVTLFANTLTNKAHPQYSYRMLANAIFDAVSE